MQTAHSHEPTRDEILRRIGRNVVNFQYLEATLRSVIPSLSQEGSVSDLGFKLKAAVRKHKKASLGNLAGAFLDDAFQAPPKDITEPDMTPAEPFLKITMRVDASKEDAAEHKRILLKLVRERNQLIHRSALDVDLSSATERADFGARLDDQNSRVCEQLAKLVAFRQAQREGFLELVRHLQSTEFLSALGGAR